MELQSLIAAVCVYTGEARVTRVGRAQLDAGRVELAFKGLPGSLLPDSVRVSGQGVARARLLGVELHRMYMREPVETTVLALTQQLRQLETEMSRLSLRVQAQEQDREFLLGLARAAQDQLAKGIAFGRAGIEQAQAVREFVGAGIERCNSASVELEVQKNDLAARIDQVRRQLDAARTPQPREGYEVVVAVETQDAGELDLQLSYVVQGAGWKPLYDLRLLEGESEPRLQVSYLAEVTQLSGEAWENVELTLSTAKPRSSGSLPELQPWYLNVYRPPKQAFRAPMMAMAEPPPMPTPEAAPDESVDRMAPAELELPTAQVAENGPALSFSVPQRISLPPDGSAHKATVAIFDLGPELDYLTVPKIEPVVHRRAKAVNISPYLLLPGQANLFWGDEFVGRAPLAQIAPGQEFEFPLGSDDRIRVERKPSAHSVEKVPLRDVRRTRYGYETLVTNLTARSQRIIVRDQIPVAGHERITVQLEETRPAPKERSELGQIEWQLDLAAGDSQTLSLVFTVDHPREMQVQGLPE